MMLDRARGLLQLQVELGSGYKRNSARQIVAEVEREHGQAAVDQLIHELGLEQVFDFRPGTHFASP